MSTPKKTNNKSPKKSNKTLQKDIATQTIPKPLGRPKHSGEKYNPIYIDIVKELAIEGYIESEIQKIIHISVRTFNKWKKEHPEFLKALKEGKKSPDQRVVKALYKNAIGETVNVEKALVVSDGSNLGSHVEIVKVKEHRPGNVTAQIYWTKNRLPKEWKDRISNEISNTDGEPFIIEIK